MRQGIIKMGIEKDIEAVDRIFGRCKECTQGYVIYVPYDCRLCGGDVVATRADLKIKDTEDVK